MRCQSLLAVVTFACVIVGAPLSRAQELPPDAAQLIGQLDQEVTAIRDKADHDIRGRTEKVIAILLQLQDSYTREGKLEAAIAIRDRIRTLRNSVTKALPDPGHLQAYRGRAGEVLFFEVVGSTDGIIYGTDTYTDDSPLATAAVHAGALLKGQRGVVKVTLFGEAASIVGSERNGVASREWTAYPSTYTVSLPGAAARAALGAPAADPGNLRNYRAQVGQNFLFKVTGRTSGTLYGTDVHTDDSSVGAAAVHDGLLKEGQEGIVRAFILGPRDSFQGSTRNGVRSSPYGAWGGSFRLEAVER